MLSKLAIFICCILLLHSKDVYTASIFNAAKSLTGKMINTMSNVAKTGLIKVVKKDAGQKLTGVVEKNIAKETATIGHNIEEHIGQQVTGVVEKNMAKETATIAEHKIKDAVEGDIKKHVEQQVTKEVEEKAEEKAVAIAEHEMKDVVEASAAKNLTSAVAIPQRFAASNPVAAKTTIGKKLLNLLKKLNPANKVVEAAGPKAKVAALVKGMALAATVTGGIAMVGEEIGSGGKMNVTQVMKDGAAAAVGNVERFGKTMVNLPALLVSSDARQDYAIDMAEDKIKLEEKFGVKHANNKTENDEVASLALSEIMKEFNIKPDKKSKKPKNANTQITTVAVAAAA